MQCLYRSLYQRGVVKDKEGVFELYITTLPYRVVKKRLHLLMIALLSKEFTYIQSGLAK